MKIKRYTAGSMRAALAIVRDEQGPDAVILSSKKLQDGVEVIAAVDYDEALIADAGKQWLAKTEALIPAQLTVPVAATEESRAVPIALPDTSYGEVRQELKDLRGLLEIELASLAWQDSVRRDPRQARILEVLAALDIAPDIAAQLATAPIAATETEDPQRAAMAAILKALPVINDTSVAAGGIFALVGPTGAGKTTTIAKLAARWVMERGPQEVALICADGYRVGAREQLHTYAQLLRVPMHFASNAAQLEQCLGRLSNKRLVLIDTAGVGQRDARLAE